MNRANLGFSLSPNRGFPREKRGDPQIMTNWATPLPALHEVCLWEGFEIPMLPPRQKKNPSPPYDRQRMGIL